MPSPTTTPTPPYMRRYFVRLLVFMSAYVLLLTASISLANGSADLGMPIRIALALLSALPIVGVFWAVFRLLVEMDDEYQRLLMVKQTLLATALTLAIATIWQFMERFDVVTAGPQWIGALWFALWGIAAPIVRWRA